MHLGLFVLFVPLAAALIGATYIVAARTAHAGKGPWSADGGWEYVLVLSSVAIGLAFNGAGNWSLDHAIGWDVSGFWWGIGAAAAALAGAGAVLAGPRRLTAYRGARRRSPLPR
jgi:putative oxidoreductase